MKRENSHFVCNFSVWRLKLYATPRNLLFPILFYHIVIFNEELKELITLSTQPKTTIIVCQYPCYLQLMGYVVGGLETDVTFWQYMPKMATLRKFHHSNSSPPIPPKSRDIMPWNLAPKSKPVGTREGRYRDPIWFLCSVLCFLHSKSRTSVLHNQWI